MTLVTARAEAFVARTDEQMAGPGAMGKGETKDDTSALSSESQNTQRQREQVLGTCTQGRDGNHEGEIQVGMPIEGARAREMAFSKALVLVEAPRQWQW